MKRPCLCGNDSPYSLTRIICQTNVLILTCGQVQARDIRDSSFEVRRSQRTRSLLSMLISIFFLPAMSSLRADVTSFPRDAASDASSDCCLVSNDVPRGIKGCQCATLVPCLSTTFDSTDTTTCPPIPPRRLARSVTTMSPPLATVPWALLRSTEKSPAMRTD